MAAFFALKFMGGVLSNLQKINLSFGKMQIVNNLCGNLNVVTRINLVIRN
jgi:hypothetical protein